MILVICKIDFYHGKKTFCVIFLETISKQVLLSIILILLTKRVGRFEKMKNTQS